LRGCLLDAETRLERAKSAHAYQGEEAHSGERGVPAAALRPRLQAQLGSGASETGWRGLTSTKCQVKTNKRALKDKHQENV